MPGARADARALQLLVLDVKANGDLLSKESWNKALANRNIKEMGKSGFCRSWCCSIHQLFHVLMVSVAEPGLMVSGEGAISPKDALTRIVEGYVRELFYCTCCNEPYLKLWDAKAWGLEQLAEDDGVGTNIWLWQMHNNITNRLYAEGELA